MRILTIIFTAPKYMLHKSFPSCVPHRAAQYLFSSVVIDYPRRGKHTGSCRIRRGLPLRVAP